MALMSKAAIVTGAAQGIGKAIAARLVKDGMRVAIVDINQEAAVAAAEELAGQYGADTMAVQCDVSQEEQVNIAVQKVLERFGTVDVLVNNAGILSLKKPFVEYTKADWDKIFGINFMGDVFFCKALIPTMKEKKSGRIIILPDICKPCLFVFLRNLFYLTLGGEGFRACTVNLKIIKLPKKRCSRGHYTFGTSLPV